MNTQMRKPKTTAVIPAHNEARLIAEVVRLTVPYVDTVIVVDDGSRDSTFEEARRAGADVLRHVVNMGKGAALKTGCEHALRQAAEIIVFLDADGQHDPRDIPDFIQELKHRDIVFAYRRFDRRMPLVFRLGNQLINTAIRVLFGIRLRDTQCGFRAFHRQVYEKIRWRAADYVIESEIIMHTAKRHLNYAEIPIKTVYHHSYKGTTVFDGLRILLNLVLMKLRG